MLQAVTTRIGVVQVEDVASAGDSPGPGEALIQVERVGICGSDGHVFDGSHPYLGYPQIQGHEVVGRIIVADPSGGGPRAGTRVVVEPARGCGSCIACRRGRANCCTDLAVIGVTRPGGLQEQLIVPASQLHTVGDLTPDAAVFAEPFSIAVHVLDRARPRPDDIVLVLGAGSIGTTVALASATAGLRTIVAERRVERRALFDTIDTVDSIPFEAATLRRDVASLTTADEPTIVIDTTGAPEVLATAIDLVAPSGTIVVVGISGGDFVSPVATLTRKELSIVGARNSLADFPRAIDLARRWGAVTTAAIRHRYPLARANEAIELVAQGHAVGKVVVEMASHAPIVKRA